MANFLHNLTDKASVFWYYRLCLDRYLANGPIQDEQFLRAVEKYIPDNYALRGISEAAADDFRRTMAAYFGQLQLLGKTIDVDSNSHLSIGIDHYIEHGNVIPTEELFATIWNTKKHRSIDARWEEYE